MSGTSSVPIIQFTLTGPIAPQESAIVAGLNADYNAAFGGNLNTDPSTPQGQLIASTAVFLGDNNDQQVFLFQGMDPALNSGRMQDGIARIYFLERNPAQSTVLQVACGGLVGVIIPVGATIADPSGNQYICTGQGVILITGTVTLSFAAVITGPLPVPASVAIYQAIPGWNTTTLVSGVVGNLVENRAQFEARRQATVAANAAGYIVAIGGAVAKVPGVIDYYVTENPTGSPVTIGDVTLVANSLYVCVAGGASADVAKAIWTKKPPGCAYNGNVTVVVLDNNSGYSPPYPAYNVTFQTPTAKQVCMAVLIANSTAVPSNAAALIQAAINLAFLGEDGGTRARIGSTLFASRYYASVATLGAWAQIVSILIGSTGNSPVATFTGAIAGTALTVSGVSGTIAVGQFVFGSTVAPGTIILSGSGTSWVVEISQTVSSVAMTSVGATNNDIAMDIDWIPTLNPANISVGLV